MSADETFEKTEDVGTKTVPVQAGALKKGDFVCINGFPCKVIEITTSKTGKHGHAKANITALDIFTNKKYEEVAPTSHNLEQPVVKKTEYTVVDLDPSNKLSLLDENNDTRDDLNMPDLDAAGNDDMKKKIEEWEAGGREKDLLIVVTNAMGNDYVTDAKFAAGGN